MSILKENYEKKGGINPGPVPPRPSTPPPHAKKISAKKTFDELEYERRIENDWGRQGAIVYRKITENNIKKEIIFYMGTNDIMVSDTDLDEYDSDMIMIDRSLLNAINQQLEEIANAKMGD